MEGIYHPAVLVSALADYLLGWLWYGVFFTGVRVSTHEPVPAIIAAAMSLTMAYVLAIVLSAGRKGGALRGVRTGLLLSIGLVAATMLENTLTEGQPVHVWLIDAGYAAVGLTMMGAVIGAWKPSKV